MGVWRGVELTGLSLSEPAPDGLRLRPYRPDDVDAVHAAMQDDQARRFLPIPQPYTRADAAGFCTEYALGRAAAGRGVELAMTLADDRYVGGAGLLLPDSRSLSAEIGYSVAAGARGRGLAARAARLLAAWGFDHDVVRIELRVELDNIGSLRSGLHAGFRLEGVRRGEFQGRNGPVDTAVLVRCAGDSADPVPPWLPPLVDVADDVVLLREITPGDHPVLTAEFRDPEARRWLVGDPPGDPDATGRARALAAGLGRLAGPTTLLAVVDRASGGVAGHLQVRGGPPGVLELGYGLLPEFRGRGLTVRALQVFAAWAFGTVGVTRLELGVDVGNGASLAVARRAGFREEGTAARRLRRPVDGGFGDELRFGLTPPV
ncbi:GNAT family N-acetyltransferase [Jatrophihabitans sp. YIM 134969]